MLPVVIGIVVLGGLAVLLSPNFAFAGTGDVGSASGDSPAGGSDTPPPSGVAMQYNSLIAAAASAAGVDPVLLKSLCAEESGFNPNSINPEKDFTLDGVSYGQNDPTGRKALVAWMKDGNDPATIGLNPSCGIAQVRVGNAKQFISGLDPWDLFDPATCLEAAAYLMADMGITLDTADMYNVGHGTNWARGVRNLPYQQKVAMYYAQFQGDF